MTEENLKLDIKASLKKGKSTKMKKPDNVSSEKPQINDNLIKSDKPVFVYIKEDWIDRIVKISALIAVLLALGTILFDYQQSKDQDLTFKSFRQKLDSTFTIQNKNAKEQHQKTIETLEKQQELMKQQNDSTLNLLRVQADRLKVQNEIWKIDQKNKIHTERVKISPTINECYLSNDTLRFKFSYSNKGQRVARNIECQAAILVIRGNFILPLVDEKPALSMNKIVPDGFVTWYINKDFIGLTGENEVYIYSTFSYEDEMYQHKFVTSEFVRIFNKDKKTEYSFCSQSQIDFIEKKTKYKDIEVEDFTIKHEFLFE